MVVNDCVSRLSVTETFAQTDLISAGIAINEEVFHIDFSFIYVFIIIFSMLFIIHSCLCVCESMSEVLL